MDIFPLDAPQAFLMAVVSCAFLFWLKIDAVQFAAHFLHQLLFVGYRKVLFCLSVRFFNRSYTLAQFPSTNFTNIVVRAVYPIQCRYQDDIPRLRSMFLKYMRISCYLIFLSWWQWQHWRNH